MNFVIVLTRRCNAACAHCSSGCGPDQTAALGRDEIFRLMRDAARLAGEPVRFALTGGEPFLDFDLLLDIAREARRLGGTATCVTNAYWAANDARARDLLGRLKAAGLTILAVSTSPFHERFVRRERVARALRIARELGFDITLKYVRARSDDRTPQMVRDWAHEAGAGEVQDIALMPYLRPGASLPAGEFALGRELPAGPCPGAAMTLREDGMIMACCTPGAEGDAFALGHARSRPLAEIKARFDHSGWLRLLRERGPAWFAGQAHAHGLGHRLRAGYTDACDLCAHMAGDGELHALNRRLGEAHEIDRMQHLLARMAGSPLPRLQGEE